MDYPKDKLEVLVLIERRDQATAQAVRDVGPPGFVRIVGLPPGPPQTKPRSCNLGLMLARGDLLVIFDAEDRPETDQLRKAASLFAAGGARLACVQARLNFYNWNCNLLTRMFSLEYAFWFDLMLAGLDRLRLPIPLGGTSNHIRTAVLRDVGGWDAWNVTEDADLGLRLASKGYRVGMLDSTTWEECPARPWAWIMQRTRWLKGYLLTLLVHTRRPADTVRCFGLSGTVSLVGLIAGTPVVFLLWPFAFVLGFAGGSPVHIGSLTVEPALAASAAMWGASLIMIISVLAAALHRRLTWLAAVLIPVYWLLHAFAAWRGLVQLIRAPYVWEKTAHRASSGGPR
jgi:cellulose synthase/poly-beta-1,6-N-acetylglucosamine synthase-like glycosyltransferase